MAGYWILHLGHSTRLSFSAAVGLFGEATFTLFAVSPWKVTNGSVKANSRSCFWKINVKWTPFVYRPTFNRFNCSIDSTAASALQTDFSFDLCLLILWWLTYKVDLELPRKYWGWVFIWIDFIKMLRAKFKDWPGARLTKCDCKRSFSAMKNYMELRSQNFSRSNRLYTEITKILCNTSDTCLLHVFWGT